MLVLRWGIVSVFLSFAVGSPHIGGTQPALLTHPSQTYSLVLPPARPGHLYVLDANAGAVLRFRLAKDGLPEKEPDAVLTAEGAELPSGLAVDRSGNMFVADVDGWAGVAKFAAGSTGLQKPVSVLNMARYGADWLRIDDDSHLFVHVESNPYNGIVVFSESARANDEPMSVIPPFRRSECECIADFVVAQSGSLYVLDSPGPVDVYEQPLRSPQRPDWFMSPAGYPSLETNFEQTLALDEASSSIYIQFQSWESYEWNVANFGVRAAARDERLPDQLIFTGQCGTASNGPGVMSAAISQSYLLMSCLIPRAVLVYHADEFGRQRLIERVGLGDLQSPDEITLGP
jgi:hypothetical protein